MNELVAATEVTDDEVRQICRQWAWQIVQDAKRLFPDDNEKWHFVVEILVSAFTELLADE